MGGFVGLRYEAVDVVMRRLKIKDPEGIMFSELQVMEYAALSVLNEKAADSAKGK